MGKHPPNRPPPPRSWDPLQRAVEDMSLSIYELVEIAENLVVNPQPHPPPPKSSGVRYRGMVSGRGEAPTRPPPTLTSNERRAALGLEPPPDEPLIQVPHIDFDSPSDIELCPVRNRLG